MDSSDRSKLRRINAKIAEIESRPPADQTRLSEMLKALRVAREEVVRF
jgi:hypothetical protein